MAKDNSLPQKSGFSGAPENNQDQEKEPDGGELDGSRVAELETQLTELKEGQSQAIASYRALVVRSNPELPEELITGDSVEEIDKSLAGAQALIDRVRQRLETEIAGARIPAGSPLRTAADLSALSPQEKIQYAMGERR